MANYSQFVWHLYPLVKRMKIEPINKKENLKQLVL